MAGLTYESETKSITIILKKLKNIEFLNVWFFINIKNKNSSF